jgi:hypothetical protein
VIATLRPDRCYGVVNEHPQRRNHRAERHRAALEAARRADTEERPHPEAELERAGMNKQSFELFFFRLRSIRARSARVGVPIPDALASFVRNSS